MNRKSSIDVLRIISALAVITIHVVTAPVGHAGDAVVFWMRERLNLVHNLMMWSVPVFFMITGYCLMKKEECSYKYCLKRVLKYVAVLFTIGLFYALLEQVYQNGTFSLKIIVTSFLNVVNGNSWEHMWFVYTIIGIYLVMPVLHSFMKNHPEEICILAVLLFLFTILWQLIGHWLSIRIEFPFGGYLFYVCFGGAVATCKINKNYISILYFFGFLATISLVTRGGTMVLNYRSLEVALMAMGIFLFVEQLSVSQNKYIFLIADCTWGIYLIHPLFVNLALKVFDINLLNGLIYVNLCIFFVVIFLISFFVVLLLKKIPIIKAMF